MKFLAELATAFLGVLTTITENASPDPSPSPPSVAEPEPILLDEEVAQIATHDDNSALARKSRMTNNNGLCMLCEHGLDQILWPLTIVESSGSTCSSLALDMAVGYPANSGQCKSHIAKWRNTCCGSTPPTAVDLKLPERPDVKKIGPHPRCGVCHTGDYPSVTSMVLTVLYIGSGSCAQFEKVGQQGLIPAHMCDPIQFFAHEPCGCGEFAKTKPNTYEVVSVEKNGREVEIPSSEDSPEDPVDFSAPVLVVKDTVIRSTDEPSSSPSSTPSAGPSSNPSASPSSTPSASPSSTPSASPSASPSSEPSAEVPGNTGNSGTLSGDQGTGMWDSNNNDPGEGGPVSTQQETLSQRFDSTRGTPSEATESGPETLSQRFIPDNDGKEEGDSLANSAGLGGTGGLRRRYLKGSKSKKEIAISTAAG